MGNLKMNRQDTFQTQLIKFEKLLVGAQMAKASSIILISLSLILVYKSRDNSMNVMLLLMGALGLVFFIDKFLSLKDIKQKSYTQTSLISSISKFKIYMAKRKQYEMYFIAFWILTLIPFGTTHLESNILGIIGVLLYIAIVGVLGYLAYKKVDKQIVSLQRIVEFELQ